MIFVDTSYWVALRNRRDNNHESALSLLREHGDSALVTSNHVRGETWTFLRRRAGHAAAVGFSRRARKLAANPSVVAGAGSGGGSHRLAPHSR